MVESKIIKSTVLRHFMCIIKSENMECLDNKIRGIANKNPHESLRGVTISNPRLRNYRSSRRSIQTS